MSSFKVELRSTLAIQPSGIAVSYFQKLRILQHETELGEQIR